jgi:hypothetical protein
MDDLRFRPIRNEPRFEPESAPEVSSKRKFKISKIISVVVALLVVVGALGAAAYFYMQNKKLTMQSQAAAAAMAPNIIAEVGKLIVLPEGEEPTVVTISDVEKLQGQAFFANAKNGDKVLVYTKSGKAVLYDPVVKKVIEVAPLNTSATNTTSTTSQTKTTTPIKKK